MPATVALDTLRDQAIAWAVGEALKRFPDSGEALLQAGRWIKDDAIQMDGTAKQATIDGLLVNAQHCPCPDALTAPEGFCVHRLAYSLSLRARQRFDQLMTRQEATGETADPQTGEIHQAPAKRTQAPPVRSQGASTNAQGTGAIERSAQQVAHAYRVTPAAYHTHLMVIQGRPYLTVDGRIAMAMAEHRERGGTLEWQTSYCQVADQWLCRASVRSSLLGLAEGHAEVHLGGKGADATNPWSVAETSAIGRALGVFGYGIFAGLASAEDMLALKEE